MPTQTLGMKKKMLNYLLENANFLFFIDVDIKLCYT